MPETLLSNSSLLLFGRQLDEISVTPVANAPNEFGNKFLHSVYSQNDPSFARIYAVSFDGKFMELEKPIILLVHGNGDPVQQRRPGNAKRGAVAPDALDAAGAIFQPQLADGLRVWTYDKNDFSIRLDTSSGMLEELLLYSDEELGYPVGGGLVGGGKVGGGKVGGGKVGGGKVGGGKVGGGKIGG